MLKALTCHTKLLFDKRFFLTCAIRFCCIHKRINALSTPFGREKQMTNDKNNKKATSWIVSKCKKRLAGFFHNWLLFVKCCFLSCMTWFCFSFLGLFLSRIWKMSLFSSFKSEIWSYLQKAYTTSMNLHFRFKSLFLQVKET